MKTYYELWINGSLDRVFDSMLSLHEYAKLRGIDLESKNVIINKIWRELWSESR